MKQFLMAIVLMASGAGVFASEGSVGKVGERYAVQDQGVFAPTGRHVEFADRYGWASYEIIFDFDFEEGVRQISEDSTLELTINKVDGSQWKYRCRNRPREMSTRINSIIGEGVFVSVECRLPPEKLARGIEVDDAKLIGDPRLAFQAIIQDGQVRAGAQKGLYILPANQIDASEIKQHIGSPEDPSVLFTSADHPQLDSSAHFVP